MSRSKPERRVPIKARSPRSTVETRIDGAHALTSKDGESEAVRSEVGEAVLAAAMSPLVATSLPTEQLRLQANQLAEHLRSRQRELDQREARLNAQLAQIDLASRQTRLWITEKQGELAASGRRWNSSNRRWTSGRPSWRLPMRPRSNRWR